MANTILTAEMFRERVDAVFEEMYSQHSKQIFIHEPYRLEQCGKLYRVKTNGLPKTEYKTGWLKLKEAQGILKLLKGNEENE